LLLSRSALASRASKYAPNFSNALSNHKELRIATQELTLPAKIVIFRRFREYPDRAVGNIQQTEGLREPNAIRSPRLTRVRKWQFALYWIQEIHRRTFLIDDLFDLNVASLRPIAIAPATPSTLDGLCGPEQRNGVGSSFEVRKDARPPSTVMSGLLYRFTDATAGKIFARDASAFSIFCVYGKKRGPHPPARLSQVWL
jgi:hypothetical protein